MCISIYVYVYDSWHISPTGLGDDYWIIWCICITISHVTLIKIMLCYVMLCYVMLCYVMLCYVMLCYVMLCYIITLWYPCSALKWRHNERNGILNHRRFNCLLHHLFMRRWKKTSKLRDTSLCEGNSPMAGDFPAQRASNAEMFPFDDVIMGI